MTSKSFYRDSRSGVQRREMERKWKVELGERGTKRKEKMIQKKKENTEKLCTILHAYNPTCLAEVGSWQGQSGIHSELLFQKQNKRNVSDRLCSLGETVKLAVPLPL